ncbi:hypothetical protein ABKV19_024356 [Rosa sericea]
MGFRGVSSRRQNKDTKQKNHNLETAELSKHATTTHLLSRFKNSGLLSIASEFESELLERVYKVRNLELMGFTDSRFDAIGIASKLSYMDFGNVGLCQTWQTPRHLFTTAHNSEVTFTVPC